MNTTLKEGVDWVGYVDWTVRDFHGYSTDRGSSYNSYLIRDEKVALIDTVKAPYAQVLLDHVEAYLKDMKFDLIREPLQVRFVPKKEDLDECRQAGKLLAEKALELSA